MRSGHTPRGSGLSTSARSATAASAGWHPGNEVELAAHSAAGDWELVLHLRELFSKNPDMIARLIDDKAVTGPLAWTVLAAAREAAAAQPASCELQVRTAQASLRLARADLADLHARRALTIFSTQKHVFADRVAAALEAGRLADAIGLLSDMLGPVADPDVIAG